MLQAFTLLMLDQIILFSIKKNLRNRENLTETIKEIILNIYIFL